MRREKKTTCIFMSSGAFAVMVVTNPAFLVAHFIQHENIFKQVGIRDTTHFVLPSAEQPV